MVARRAPLRLPPRRREGRGTKSSETARGRRRSAAVADVALGAAVDGEDLGGDEAGFRGVEARDLIEE